MEVKIKFRDSDARMAQAMLRRRYNSKAGLQKLVKTLIWDAVAEECATEMEKTRERYRTDSQPKPQEPK